MFMMFLLELAFCIQQKPYILYNTYWLSLQKLSQLPVYTLLLSYFAEAFFANAKKLLSSVFNFLRWIPEQFQNFQRRVSSKRIALPFVVFCCLFSTEFTIFLTQNFALNIFWQNGSASKDIKTSHQKIMHLFCNDPQRKGLSRLSIFRSF